MIVLARILVFSLNKCIHQVHFTGLVPSLLLYSVGICTILAVWLIQLVLCFHRNRVHQIVGATHNMQRRSGNMLPPPLDDPLNGNGVTTDNAIVGSALKVRFYPMQALQWSNLFHATSIILSKMIETVVDGLI